MEHYVSVMQYSKNKVKCVLQFDGIEKIYVKSGIIVGADLAHGITTTFYCKLNNKRELEYSACSYIGDGYTSKEESYYISKNEVSKSVFTNWINKYTKGDKGKQITNLYEIVYENSKNNRNKYLK